jgi:broad specificity phosphatase PhoE
MKGELPILYLARHGDTDWSESGQHTGRTDLPLNKKGEQRARQLAPLLSSIQFARVFCSPLQRATKTCALAGFGDVATREPDLLEWDYGRYEGKVTKDILSERPGWKLFRDGCPEGELPQDVAARARTFILKARSVEGNVLAFSSGHIIRMIAACWLGLPPIAGALFNCFPASVGTLGFAHGNFDEPILKTWNLSPDSCPKGSLDSKN